MPLTPADVSNVEFKKPRMGKRGYDEDEVDDFLDRLEAELARLIEENNDLKQQVSAAEKAADEPAATSTDESPDGSAAVASPVASAPRAAGSTEEEPEQTRALGMLALAKETADRAVAEARAEADRLLTDARERSSTMEGDAKEHAEKLERDAREKAEQLTTEAEQTKRDILAELGREQATLEQTIASLRSFESDYRARMEDFLQTELRDLRDRGRVEPADGPPAGPTDGAGDGPADGPAGVDESGDGELASVGAADDGDSSEQHD